MKVVLLQEVQGIGGPGTVKDVADGYARNYLLPKKLATPATAGALKQVERVRAVEDRRQARLDEQAAAMAARIDGQEVTFRVRAGEEGRLYGSVTNGDVAEVLSRQIGEDVDKRRVILEEPIHVLGTYEVPVRLSASHSPVVKVVVEAEG
ncbi:MAG: 50S ribosomal protein L9 [Chloroflexia bacterium]|nr:50S ribosomal protein L9 [Chloroflexia bacterium]